MKNLRKHGRAPFTVAVIHGGPGAAGEMAPVAKELSKTHGILEPLQTRDSVDGQVQELKQVIEKHGEPPIVLVGWSWGAYLSYILAAKYPELVKQLILISSASFTEKYFQQMKKLRQGRFNEKDKMRLQHIRSSLDNPSIQGKNDLLAEFGRICGKVDSFNPLDVKPDPVEVSYDIYRKVWSKASALRKSGKLLELGKNIRCPVLAIHGDYDSHPSEGVRGPLMTTVKDFRFMLLRNCGHKPWIEKAARKKFYEALNKGLK